MIRSGQPFTRHQRASVPTLVVFSPNILPLDDLTEMLIVNMIFDQLPSAVFFNQNYEVY
jgi:hypothetical protein